jgi:carbon monoxide dehydrogenase subunit G
MKVTIEKTFPMPGRFDVVYGLLQNVEGVARCMPGARITARIDDTHFKGTVSVKVGPASMAFKGDIEVKELDATRHVLRLVGKGSDSSGTSGASMDLTARVEPGATPESSNLIGVSEVTMSGKAAAFGGRMMGSVADQILKQFGENFAKQVSAAAGAESATGVTSAAAPPVMTSASAPAVPTGQSAPIPAQETANQINALALLWTIIRDWFRGIFRRKPA